MTQLAGNIHTIAHNADLTKDSQLVIRKQPISFVEKEVPVKDENSFFPNFFLIFHMKIEYKEKLSYLRMNFLNPQSLPFMNF